MKVYHKFLLYHNKWIRPYISKLLVVLEVLTYLSSFLIIIGILYRYGSDLSASQHVMFKKLCKFVWVVFLIDVTAHILLSYKQTKRTFKKITWFISSLFYLSLLPVIFHQPDEEGAILNFWNFLNSEIFLVVLLLIFALFYLSNGLILLLGRRTNPSLILGGSFLFIILVGSVVLMLPKCTVADLSWVDSLFVSTSAVCVTGLSPVDIPTTFTTAGLIVILILIQVGGLGVMTFTSFFAMFFMGNTSVYNQLVVKDMLEAKSINSLLSALLYILLFTLVLESVGAVIIWFNIHDTMGMELGEEILFSVFHSISAFCNAGFSTLPDGLGDSVLSVNHNVFYLVVAALILLGGIGFPILVNFKDSLVTFFRKRKAHLTRTPLYPPPAYRQFSLNTRIVLIATVALVLVGTLLVAIFEWNGILANRSVGDKIVGSFFTAVCPRSAGFSTSPIIEFQPQTIMLYLLFMWIGGASQSTAGGVKVNAIAVVFFTLIAVIKGNKQVEVFGREISSDSIRRANATVFVSLLVIFCSIFVLSLLEPDISYTLLTFECIAALSTAGLSVDITPLFGTGTKLFVTLLMFIGRVGLITLLLGMAPQQRTKRYRYPSGDIIIN